MCFNLTSLYMSYKWLNKLVSILLAMPKTIYINKIPLDEFIFQNISLQIFRENESNVTINEKSYRHELLSYNVKRLVLPSHILKNQVNYLRTAILSTLSHTQYNFARACFIFNVQFNFERWLRRRGYYCVVLLFRILFYILQGTIYVKETTM